MKAATQFFGSAKTAYPARECLTALVVDPSPEQRQVVRVALQFAGYAVHEAIDTAAALWSVRGWAPDVIVTGVSMPGPCDGLGLCDIVRLRPHLRRCVVVVMTGRTDPDRLRRIDEAGAAALIPQPFTAARLLAVISGATGRTAPLASPGRRRPQSMLARLTRLAIPE